MLLKKISLISLAMLKAILIIFCLFFHCRFFDYSTNELFVLGIAAGHIYYFLEDVFPKQKAGFKILHTPRIL